MSVRSLFFLPKLSHMTLIIFTLIYIVLGFVCVGAYYYIAKETSSRNLWNTYSLPRKFFMLLSVLLGWPFALGYTLLLLWDKRL